MSALSTPNLGPQNFPARRGGSVTGGPWQLIEVSGKDTAKSVSQNPSRHGTPLITAQRTPPNQPAGGPAELEEWNIDAMLGPPAMAMPEPELKGQTGRGGRGSYAGNGNYARWGEEEDENDPGGFNAQYFIGDWTDSLGHRVIVTPSENGGRQRDRRRRNKGGGKGGAVFLAVMQKFGMPDKRFNVNKDRKTSEWTCGTGALLREESDAQTIKWKAADGRISKWARNPPEGPVFFDAPAAPTMQDEHPPPWWNQGMQMHPGGPVYFLSEYNTGPPQGEWKGLHLPPDDGQLQQTGDNAGKTSSAETAADQETTTEKWNVGAPEFVPSGPPAAAASTTPQLKPATAPSTPQLKPASGPTGVQALACQLKLSEESPDAQTAGNRLEWVLPDNWGKLNRLPKDFCLTSPMFGVRQAANMQLVFYPNGSRTAEAGRCTVALTRGPDSAGIKFEFSVNQRGSGPKVCLGRRYLGDYPKPFDESEDNKEQQVIVCMQVLEVLGI